MVVTMNEQKTPSFWDTLSNLVSDFTESFTSLFVPVKVEDKPAVISDVSEKDHLFSDLPGVNLATIDALKSRYIISPPATVQKTEITTAKTNPADLFITS